MPPSIGQLRFHVFSLPAVLQNILVREAASFTRLYIGCIGNSAPAVAPDTKSASGLLLKTLKFWQCHNISCFLSKQQLPDKYYKEALLGP